MSEYVKFATSAGDQYLSTLSEFQDSILKSMTPFTEMMPSMPESPVASMFPEMPTMAEITEANFAFANKFLKQQKKFAEKFFAVATPETA